MSERFPILISEEDHVLGVKDAPVILVEYADYQCPYSAQAEPYVKEICRSFVGQVRYVFKNFPLVAAHPRAWIAAEAAEAAASQGRYWEMHDRLFRHDGFLGEQVLLRYAREIGLDDARFMDDLRNGRYSERVERDVMEGIDLGVSGTPCFFINNRRFEQDWSTGALLAGVRAALDER